MSHPSCEIMCSPLCAGGSLHVLVPAGGLSSDWNTDLHEMHEDNTGGCALIAGVGIINAFLKSLHVKVLSLIYKLVMYWRWFTKDIQGHFGLSCVDGGQWGSCIIWHVQVVGYYVYCIAVLTHVPNPG